MYSPRFQVSPGSRSKYLHIFAPAQNFQDIENSISNAYLSKVLPAKTPQSLFRLFATNLHKMSPVKVAQHRRLPWQDSLCRFYILSGIRIKSLTLKLSVPTLTTAQIFDANQILLYQINRYRIVCKKKISSSFIQPTGLGWFQWLTLSCYRYRSHTYFWRTNLQLLHRSIVCR